MIRAGSGSAERTYRRRVYCSLLRLTWVCPAQPTIHAGGAYQREGRGALSYPDCSSLLMKKTLLIIALLALLVAGIGYWYYRDFGGGPTYSLLQAVHAVQAHNAADFERYVDVERVTDKLVDEVAGQANTMRVSNGNAAAVLRSLSLLKPVLRRTTRTEVQRYVETGTLQTSSAGPLPGLSVVGLAGQVLGAGGQFRGIQYVRENGGQALVGVAFAQSAHNTTAIIELRMVDKGDHWQVVEITNAGELIRQAARGRK